jgi:Beta-lactamase enzyme family
MVLALILLAGCGSKPPRVAGRSDASPAGPTSWAPIDEAVRSVAPRVHMLVADITGGSCVPIHAIDAAAAAPLGSAFKLYELAALGEAVAAGRVSWDQQLIVTAGVKSLPSGALEALPDGTRVSVREAADKMISISDNTAADMLIELLGRPAIEASLARAGMAGSGRDVPFLTTRELFALKLEEWPALANRYAHAGRDARWALLSALDGRAVPGIEAIHAWTTPRAIDRVEWFASAEDLCRVYISLSRLARRPGLDPIAGALEINDGGLGLDPARWPTTWFKGGSEPGVLTLTYEAATRTGRAYFVGILASDPGAPIDETAAGPRLLAAIKSAFGLAAASGA